MACGVASNYAQLAAARMTVGFGEAGGVPPSYAIISDYFPSGKRGMALGIYNLGPPIGAALGIAFGASIAAAYSWRDAFIVLGGIGVLAAMLIILVVREPVRGGLDPAHHSDAGTAAASFWQTIVMFFSRPSLVLAAVASGVTQIITYGSGTVSTLFLMREKGMTLEEVALWYALVVIVGMGGGMLVSGRIIDKMTAKSRRYFASLPAGSLAISMPFYIAFLWAPEWPLALVLLTIVNFFNYFYLSCAVTLTQEESAPNQRVLAGALLLLVANFIGLGLGPTWVGAASDWLAARGHANSLQLALYTLTPFYLIAIAHFLVLARRLRRLEANS
jgi:MFS family permease